MKDNFSLQSSDYSKYRPGYPASLFDFILSPTAGRQNALDAATGNGQVAAALSAHFQKVSAIDISEKQLLHRVVKNNIVYVQSSAENTAFANNQFDLITVGQAAHWFDLPEFYREIKRILIPGGTLALFGYKLFTVDEQVDLVISEFYINLLGPFWDAERKLVDDAYESLLFPFAKIEHPPFQMDYFWTLEALTGFLGTWSAVQHYKNKHAKDPLETIADKLTLSWGNETIKKITFPVFLLMTKSIK